MFLIRQSKPEDVATLFKLAKMVYFINLPPNEQIISAKIEHSSHCFKRVSGQDEPGHKPSGRKSHAGHGGLASMEQDSEFFMFSLEDTRAGGIIGTSQVRAHQGGPGNPNWAFKISEKRTYSESLRFGTNHAVGQLYGDESGPTEIGGLIIQPSYRGHEERPGRLLSFVRFHFIGLFREIFDARVLAEMMAPVTAEGDNTFWDAFGRKFIPVKFAEADRFCQHNRAFIPELLPKEEIYLSLFPLEVQNAIGVVSRETIPARRILESLGFLYRGFIDPFDGGPHLDAPTDEIPLVRDTRRMVIGKEAAPQKCDTPAIVSTIDPKRGFLATQACVEVAGEKSLRLPKEVMKLLGVKAGATVGFTPMQQWARDMVPESKIAATPGVRRAKPAAPRDKPKPAKPRKRTAASE
ncbi:MAG: arginine N-succinyltransferase [Phycisphaeraceae bacterium]|nr:arginine N-succinyltransferase [Phycisphaeraceae bacterium]